MMATEERYPLTAINGSSIRRESGVLTSARLSYERNASCKTRIDLIKAVNAHDMKEMWRLAKRDPDVVRDTYFTTSTRTGSAEYDIRFAHLLTLSVCLEESIVDDVSGILKSIYGGRCRGGSAKIDAADLWEFKPEFIMDVSALQMAAYYNCYDMVSLLLAIGASPNKQTKSGLSTLHMSILGFGGKAGVIRALLEKGADTNLADHEGSTCLHQAMSEKCDLTIIELLVRRGRADVNAERHRGIRTPLMQAVVYNHAGAVLGLLLDAGADLHYKTPKRKNVLHLAITSNNLNKLAMVRTILDAGGAALVSVPDNTGMTPLMLAVWEENVAIVEELTRRAETSEQLAFTNLMGVSVWDVSLDATGNGKQTLPMLVSAHKKQLVGQTAGHRTFPAAAMSPLQVAVKRDSPEELHSFLRLGISPDERDLKHNNTFLHAAAAENNYSVLKELWEMYSELLVSQNKNLDTVLHVAMREGDKTTIQIIFDKLDSQGLTTLLSCLNKQKHCPLHVCCNRADHEIAELTGNAIMQKTQGAPDIGLASLKDAQGNSLLHLAARNNLVKFCEKLLAMNVSPTLRNELGNTPLHEAVLSGHLDTVDLLLNIGGSGDTEKRSSHGTTCDLHQKNLKGKTILHCATLSPSVSPELLIKVTEALQATDGGQETLNDTDHNGNSALHLLLGRDDITDAVSLIEALSLANFYTVNGAGDTPLHVAAKNANPAVLFAALEVLRKNHSRSTLNVENGGGRTVFMLSIASGHHVSLRTLINEGSDLTYRTKATGDTVLHHLIRLSVQQPNNIERWKRIYAAICDQCVTWWCQKNDIVEPKTGTKYFFKLRSFIMKYLTSAVKNGECYTWEKPSLGLTCDQGQGDLLHPEHGSGHTVVQLACLVGAAPMLGEILNTPGIYCVADQLGERRTRKYDVTFLTPDSTYFGGDKIAVSAFEYLSLTPESLVVPFLSITPLQDLARDYWKRYQWIYSILMVVHIIYMACFCYFGLMLHHVPSKHVVGVDCDDTIVIGDPEIYNHTEACSDAVIPDVPFPGWHSLLLIWPVTMAIYQMFYIIRRCSRHVRARILLEEWNVSAMVARKGFGYGFRLFHKELNNITSIVFGALVMLWYVFLALRSVLEVYFLSVAFGVGWLLTIIFAGGFETINSFTTMIKYIIIRDITRFMFFFVFVFLGFSFAQHALFLHSPTYVAEHPTLMYTLFYVFQMMISIADPFSAEYDHDLYLAGIDVAFPKVIYVIFMLINAIILLNILIAMMTTSYVNLKAIEASHWRLANLKLAIDLEKNLSRVKYFLRAPQSSRHNIVKERSTVQPRSKYGTTILLASERYYFTLPEPTDVSEPREEGARDAELERRLETAEESIAHLSKQLSGQPGAQ